MRLSRASYANDKSLLRRGYLASTRVAPHQPHTHFSFNSSANRAR